MRAHGNCLHRIAHWALLAVVLSTMTAVYGTPTSGAVAPQAEPPVKFDLYEAALQAMTEGRAEEASSLLMRFLAEEPQHAGAWLDLAITQCNMGNALYAEQLFSEIEQRFDPPPGIRDVIASLRSRGCVRPAAERNAWQATFARGHDDNVNQGASTGFFQFSPDGPVLELDPDYRPRADGYTMGALYYSRLLSPRTYAIAQLYQRTYDSMHQQDTLSVTAGLERTWVLDQWRVRSTALLGAGTLDHNLYQRQGQLQLRAFPPNGLPEHYEFALLASATRIDYPSRPNYSGTILETGVLLGRRLDGTTLQGGVSWTVDDASSSRPGGNRHGAALTLQWYTAARPDVYVDASLTHQYWLSERDYAPGLIDSRRRQNITVARAAVQWYFRPRYSLHLEWRDTFGRDSIPLFQYRSRAVQLSLRWDNF